MANPISAELAVETVVELLQHDVRAAPPLKDSGNNPIAHRGFKFAAFR